MFYYYLRFLNYVFTVFGLRKPFPNRLRTPDKSNFHVLGKLWSLFIIVLTISGVVLTLYLKTESTSNIKTYLKLFHKSNNMVVNVLVIFIHLIEGENICTKLYETIEKIFHHLRITDENLKMLSIKFYIGVAISSSLVIIFVVLEVLKGNPFILIITLPTYFSTIHLTIHICTIYAILKVIALIMFDMLTFDDMIKNNTFIEAIPTKLDKVIYLFNPDIHFIRMNQKDYFELKFLCKIYDELSTCTQLLQHQHGTQMLLTFWLMFTNAVFGVTAIASNVAEYPYLVVARCILPFSWCFFGSYVNNQIENQVEQIDILIVKYLIDFRCDRSRKIILQTFKQLVGTHRLQFTACSLFHLNYSMILGTVVNVITYSIILIQLFLNDTT